MMEILIFISVVIAAVLIFDFIKNQKLHRDGMKAIAEMHQKEIQDRAAAIMEEENFNKQYGTCNKSLCKDEKQRYVIRVYEESQTIVIDGKPYKFSDLIGCEGSSVPREEVFKTTTTTDTGNMVVRAAVGGALFGVPGALTGAVTAKKQTRLDKEQETRNFHRALYDNSHRTGSVIIYLKSISTPSVEISCYKLEEKEICALINAIIAITN